MSIFNSLLSGLDATSVVIFLLVFLVGYYWLTRPKNMPPGPAGLPVVGSLLKIREVAARGEILNQMTEWWKTYGDVFTIKMGNENMVVISDFKILQDTFVKQGDVFSNRPLQLYIFQRIVEATGSGVLTSSGPMWKELRRVTLTAMRDFGVGKKSLEQRVQDEARAIVEVLEKREGRPVEAMTPLLSKFASNVICSIILGNRYDYDDSTFIHLTKLVNNLTSQPLLFFPVNYLPILRFTPAGKGLLDQVIGSFETIDNFLSKVLKDHEDTYDAREIRDFVDLYIKTRSESENAHLYDARNMRRVIIDLFTAGTDTTATTVSWAVLYFAAYPEVQTRCQQEVDKVLGDRLATLDDRKSMPYIEAFITELYRITTVAPLAVPHLAVREAKVGKYTVPAGTIVIGHIRAIHHNPDNWPQPSVFKPERFLDKDGKFCPPKENFLPFSIGPRTCVGEILARMEVFILLTTLVRSFTFAMENGQKPDLVGDVGIIRFPVDQPVVAKLR